MDETLTEALKYLRLPGLLAHWDEYLRLAQKGRYSHLRLLQHVIEEEHKLKRENARRLRIQRAQLPEHLVLETFPFQKQPKLNRARIVSLYDSFDYMQKRQNIIWVGPTGTGKTGLASGFLLQALERGYKGRYVLFSELVGELFRAAADHSEPKVLNRYLSYDCLLIDELGYVDIEPVQVGLFFTLMQKRHKKTTNLITSNLGFGEWQSFLKNEHLTAALIDRLTENSHVINMKSCVSLRPKLEAGQ
jgi:DNA replication protein DnaC